MGLATLETRSQTLQEFAEKTIERAVEKGANEAQVITSYDEERRVTIENSQFSLANTTQTQGVHLGIHRRSQKGSASTNMVADDVIDVTVDAALDIAKYTLPDRFLNYLTPQDAPSGQTLPFLYRPQDQLPEVADLKDAMEEICEELIKDRRVCLERFDLSANRGTQGLFNSHGVKKSESQAMMSWSFVAMAQDGDDVVSGMDYHQGFSYDLAGFGQKGLMEAGIFREKILQNLKPIKCPSYKGLVLFSPRALEELFLDFVLFSMSGRQVMDGYSKWGQKVGQKVMSNLITIEDRPWEAEFMGATSYDADGAPTGNLMCIDKGELCTLTQDTYSAKKTGKPINGTAGGLFGVTLLPGNMPLTEIFGARETLLLVDRFSGNTDPITGSFSGVAKSSHLYRNGERQGAVKETMIAGNFFDMCDQVMGLSDVSENIEGRYQAPYCLFDGIDVTG